jgi:long-chain acyl-CoA synthetase
MLKANKLFAEVVMVGNRRNFPAALVVPNFEQLEKWAKEQKLPFTSREQLVERSEVVALYEKTVAQLSADLAQFERIKKVALLPGEFTLEAGELTPTLKVKRRFVEQKYQDLIDTLYRGQAS